MPEHIVGIEGGRTFEAGERRVHQAEGLLYDPTIAPGELEIRVVPDSLIITGQRGLELSQILQSVTALVVRLGMVRLQGDDALEKRDGASEVLRLIGARGLGVQLV